MLKHKKCLKRFFQESFSSILKKKSIETILAIQQNIMIKQNESKKKIKIKKPCVVLRINTHVTCSSFRHFTFQTYTFLSNRFKMHLNRIKYLTTQALY